MTPTQRLFFLLLVALTLACHKTPATQQGAPARKDISIQRQELQIRELAKQIEHIAAAA